MSRVRGLELLFNLSKKHLKSREDCLVAAIHCMLINEHLQCVGTGDAFTDADTKRATELLPEGWNDNQEVYTLRYASKDFKNRYLIKIVKTGHIMHVNAVLNEDTTATVSVNVDKYVKNDYSEYSTTYQELDSLSGSFRSEILENIQSPNKKSAPKSRDQVPARPRSPHRPMGRNDEPPPFPCIGGRSFPCVGGRPFPSVGGSDLDPLGRGQGGMILDPSSFGIPSRPRMPPGLPRGAVPPGARFDPFGPPIRGPNRFEPNPDHYRPPDYYYDDDDII